MNFDNFIHNEKNIPKDLCEKQVYFENLRLEFLKEIKESTENKDFFSKYTQKEIDAFMLQYANKKAYLSDSYKYFDERIKDIDYKFKVKAEEMFSTIKQKKLFNLQVQWRAEEIELDGVEITHDFDYWQNHINECYFIPRITDYEVQILKDYILSGDYQPYDDYGAPTWQMYDMFFSSMNFIMFEGYPEWYKYYDDRLGTGALLSLPNTRREKENYYFQIEHKKLVSDAKKKREEELNSPDYVAPVEPLPKLFSFMLKEMAVFAKRYEPDPHIKELFRLYYMHYSLEMDSVRENKKKKTTYNPNKISDDYLNGILMELDEIKEPVEMIAGMEWREAIITSYENYRSKKIVSLLDGVYEEYQMFEDMGIKGTKLKEELLKELKGEHIEAYYRKHILGGREILGEPQDFDF